MIYMKNIAIIAAAKVYSHNVNRGHKIVEYHNIWMAINDTVREFNRIRRIIFLSCYCPTPLAISYALYD
jgi:hypothetical protein